MTDRPPLPPFDRESRPQKVQAAEDAWNTRDPRARRGRLHRGLGVAQPRRRSSPAAPRSSSSSPRKWERELDYALRKDLWAFGEQPDRRALPVRVPRRAAASGGAAMATSCGSSTSTAYAPPRGEHQRRRDRGVPSGGSSAPVRRRARRRVPAPVSGNEFLAAPTRHPSQKAPSRRCWSDCSGTRDGTHPLHPAAA